MELGNACRKNSFFLNISMHCIGAQLANCFAKTLRGFVNHGVVEQIAQLIEQRCALTLKRLAAG